MGSFHTRHWISEPWSSVTALTGLPIETTDTNRLELLSIVISASTFASPLWTGKTVVFYTDNMMAYEAMCGARSFWGQRLMKEMEFVAMKWGFRFEARWVAGKLNPMADSLSRGFRNQDVLPENADMDKVGMKMKLLRPFS
ncbi:hypothetical protein BC829DRAFT_405536, partial [Chytridium lagenaria]